MRVAAAPLARRGPEVTPAARRRGAAAVAFVRDGDSDERRTRRGGVDGPVVDVRGIEAECRRVEVPCGRRVR